MRKLASLLFMLATAAVSIAQAQELPGRVGRIAHIEGQASLYQDPDAGWEKAYVNSPVTSENSVWTDRGSRAEVRVSSMALRLDELTQLDIPRLDDSELEAFIGRGSVAVRVRHYENNEHLVFNTPNTRVRLRGNGRYRIDVDHERGETRVTVFAGEARIGGEDGRMRVAAGRSVLIFGADRPEFVEEPASNDPFDRWTLARDERWGEGRAPTYVSTNMTGYEDLDANGQWVQEPDYGALWYPSRVAATWAPYRYGHWSNVRPWGWTWVDDAPWGYAPFHYGRWVYVRNRWAWAPGERVAQPVWAPALVAWVGGASYNLRASSAPSVGWYPLSPWDRYDPWFRASPTYVTRVNVVVRNDRPTRDDRRHWYEATRERGTTVVDRSALMDRRPIAQAAIPVTVEAIRQAQVSRQPESILPSRNDYMARRRQQPQAAVAAPTAPVAAQQPAQAGAPASQQPPGRATVARPDFARRPTVATPQAATAPPGRGPATAQQPVSREERERAVRQQTDQAIRDAQQQGQAPQRNPREAQQAQERAQREAQQAQERAQREAAQQQQQQREAQQGQERAQREATQQQQQQRQAQERAQREAQQAQQAQERAQREAQQQTQQQQQQRQAQERAQRDAQQAQEKAQREAAQQQQQQRQAQQAQERAQREAAQQQQQQQQQQQKAQPSREERERAVRQQTDQAIREAQGQKQVQEKAQREAQQQGQQQQQAQERAAKEAQRQKEKEAKEKEDKDKEKEGKGKGNKP